MKRPCRLLPMMGLISVWVMALGAWGCSAKDNAKDTGKDGTPSDTDAGTDGGTDNDIGTDSESDADTLEELVEQRVEEVLSGLTLDQKISQMMQGQLDDVTSTSVRDMCLGSVFNGGEEPISPNRPENWASAIDALQQGAMDGCGVPILYGIDAVHGNAKVIGATVFPHNIGLGATGDADLVTRVGQATARECRGAGIHMTFGPSVSVVRDERWGRAYEGFGETSEINATLGAAYIRGLQGMGDLSDPGAVAATAKHYVGDGGTTGGTNNGVNDFGEATMRAIHLPPYVAAVNNQVAAIMPSYHQWNRDGVAHPLTADAYAITDILKEEIGFDGFCISDYDAIPHASGMGIATYTDDNVADAVTAGIDMAMISADRGISEFTNAVHNGMAAGAFDETRIDDSVRRILRIKVRMGLFENPFSNPELRAQTWSVEHRELAREAVRKSLVLLKNDAAALPLNASDAVVVAGPFADMMGVQAGGWTVSWQGDAAYDTTEVMGETILQGLTTLGGANVTWDETGENLTAAGKVVVVLGELPYAEGYGDHDVEDHSIYLSDCLHYDVLTRAIASGKQVVLVIISGRPMILDSSVWDGVDAIVAAWLPGSRGIGVADVLYAGAYNFTGKLTHTWPASFDQIPVNVNKQLDEPGYDASKVTPLYPYGHGLTY